jgi:hypothetical protein
MHPEDYRNLSEARGDISTLQVKIADLQRRLEKQTILLRALFVLLRDREAVTEEHLLASFRQCELERSNAPTKHCASCGRTINLRHNRCLYCDEACAVQSAFDLVDAGVWRTQQDQSHSITATPPIGEAITEINE